MPHTLGDVFIKNITSELRSYYFHYGETGSGVLLKLRIAESPIDSVSQGFFSLMPWGFQLSKFSAKSNMYFTHLTSRFNHVDVFQL